MGRVIETTRLTETIQETIAQERRQREAQARENSFYLIPQGERQKALDSLLFFTLPKKFPVVVDKLIQQIETGFGKGNQALREEYLAFLVELVLALRSLLPRWNLQNAEKHGRSILTQARLEATADHLQAFIQRLAHHAPEAEAAILSKIQLESEARYKAELAPDPEQAAKVLTGSSLGEFIENYCRELSQSQLRRIAEMRFSGETDTELSNDYAAFLQHTLYLGVSFATTNPPLVNMAWDILPGTWNLIIDGIITSHPEADVPHLAKLVTLEVVVAQMRLLRPIFLLNEGRMGSVCLQVDPGNHADSQAMVADALFFYDLMRCHLNGGIPNVVFKLPGTQAGLEACRDLTGRGIGVTITVNFGMFQHLPFAVAMSQGQAIYSNLVEMNGRLAFPVRDELLAKLEVLSAQGINEAAARQAAAWSGVIIAKRLYQALKEGGMDQSRSKILIASLRVYQGESYQSLPSAFPDITEITGARLLSVFPNVRYAYDHAAPVDIQPCKIEAPIPAGVMGILAHSEIFKQAYYLPGDDARMQPAHELTLQDEQGTYAWAPVYNTLTEFMRSYNTLMQRITERKAQLMG
jgi:transaldolase